MSDKLIPTSSPDERDQYGFKIDRTRKNDVSTKHTRSKSSVSLVGRLKTAVVTLAKDKWDDYRQLDPDVTSITKDTKLVILIRYSGLPQDLRPKMWPLLTNAKSRQSQNKIAYRDIIDTQGHKDTRVKAQIEVDLRRTMPTNKLFESEEGISKLRNLLVAFSWVNPKIGYCQSMNFWAAFLLLFLDEEMAFWMVRCVVEELLPPAYYTDGMFDAIVDGHTTMALLEIYLPKVHHHLSSLGVDVPTIVTQWFLCLFITQLPTATALRFWDCFCQEGHKMLFRTALAIFKLFEAQILELESFETAFMFVSKLPRQVTDIDAFIDACFDKIWLMRFHRAKINSLRRMIAESLRQDQQFRSTRRSFSAATSTVAKPGEDSATSRSNNGNSQPPTARSSPIAIPSRTVTDLEEYRPKSWRAEIYQDLHIIEGYLG